MLIKTQTSIVTGIVFPKLFSFTRFFLIIFLFAANIFYAFCRYSHCILNLQLFLSVEVNREHQKGTSAVLADVLKSWDCIEQCEQD